jgi:hypothetical protein
VEGGWRGGEVRLVGVRGGEVRLVGVRGGAARLGGVWGSGMKIRSQVAPVGDELFVDAVELVLVLIEVPEPEPLDDAGFVETCGGVGIEFEEFDLAVLITKIEPSIDGGMVFIPGLFDIGDKVFWYGEPGVELFVDHVLDGAEAEVPEFGGGLFDEVDLVETEGIVGALVPIRRARCMEAKAELFDGLLPVISWMDGEALHRGWSRIPLIGCFRQNHHGRCHVCCRRVRR